MKLNARHEKAIRLLLEGMAAPAVARQVGISKPSIYRWLADPDFAVLLANHRAALRQEIVSSLHSKATKAVEVIETLMDSPHIPALVKLRAAQDILDRVVGSAETRELEEQADLIKKLIEETNEFRGTN